MNPPDDKPNVPKAPPDPQGLRVSGLFLFTIGFVIAGAFFYPFLSRRGSSLWELSSQSPHAFKVLITGGCCGLIVVVIGTVMANWHKQRVPTYRAQRPSEGTTEHT